MLSIWWRHEIWKSKILKFDFLKNEKSFWSEIKTFFLVWQVLSLRLKKQTSKNVADTTFKKVNKKYGKRIVLIFLYTLYKAHRMSESSFSYLLITVFPFSFVSNATTFFIHSLNRFVLKKSCLSGFLQSIGYPFRFLQMQIYLLNACKLDWEENIFYFCVE